MSEKNENVKIQIASIDDAEELLAIYAPYVEKTAITFEYEVPSVEEFKGRIAHVLQIPISEGCGRRQDSRICLCKPF